MGATPPPELSQFLVEQAFYQELGISRGVSLDDMPHRQLADYSLFIEMLNRERNRPQPKR